MRLDPDYFRLACDLAFRRAALDQSRAAAPITPEENLGRLLRHEAGDMTERCFRCGRDYVNAGDFPYCSWTCAAQARRA